MSVKQRALIAMSGGVDSSVAAKLIVEQGYESIGCTMKLYDNEDAGISRSKSCCSLDDVEDARQVARKLGIRHYVMNFRDDFVNTIIERFARCYESGITPNPCIDCNRHIKFEALFRRAASLECDYVVTGHYARIEKKDGRYFLKKGLDDNKDQSYVLYDITQDRLAHTLFPMGGYTKTETRKMAEESGFINARKPDSQDICFVPDGDYASAIERYTGRKSIPGNFVSLDGKVMGQHKGIIHYTIGQRRGLGLAVPESVYVCRIDRERNEVILGRESDLYSKVLTADHFNWISGELPEKEVRCCAKVRYRQKEQPATVFPLDKDRARIVFDEPQRAITAGQSVVLYDEDTVLGGGIICETEQKH